MSHLRSENMWRLWIVRGLALAIGLLGALILLEIVLRVLPVHEGAHRLPVNETNPVIRFEPNRQFLWSRDWNFSLVNRVNVNNHGFVSDHDYAAEGTDPLLAVIGDSFIEAFMVPFPETCTGRLAELLQGEARVYPFAVGGAPLSQYLAYAAYARDMFHPDGLVVVVIGNDFDESLRKYNYRPGYHYFVEGPLGELELERTDYNVSFLKRVFRNSALARYLMHNLELGEAPSRIRRILNPDEEPAVGDPGAEASLVADSKRMVEQFLQVLPEYAGLEPEQIVFVVDGMRPQLYDDKMVERARGSYVDVMRNYFMEMARDGEFEVVDLHPVFANDFKAHHEIFEYPQDAHWNARGHRICFEEVARSTTLGNFGRLFATSGSTRGN